ncbi:gluconate 5-dehydrogenase [Achromobacter xylosoxidans]|nr:gluconate 5-dehydrogenase [Achromobacter xylosoxidans]
MRQTMFRADLFLGQRILITGGGTGLGYAMARQLAAGGQVHVHPVDIRDAGRVDAMVARIWDQHGGWMRW